MNRNHSFTAYIEWDEESKMYIGSVPTIKGAHTYANSLDQLQTNLQEVISLCLKEMDSDEIMNLPSFAGVTQVNVWAN